MTQSDPRAIIEQAPMSRFQWTIVWIMVALNALDGFDVLSISFAAPGVAREWGVDRASLGVVLSMELIGMSLGSITLGGVADRLGRRRTVLGCLPVMAIGMIGASLAGSVVALSVWRVVTGIGIGGMLAVTNAAVAEAANAKRRSLCVVLMATGYPIGAVIGGAISAELLKSFDWPIVFQFGALMTLCMIPIVWAFAPESIAFEMQRGDAGRLARINATLRRMGHDAVAALPAPAIRPRRAPLAELFTPDYTRRTILMTIAYFAHITTFYYLLKWIPKIVVDMGFAPSTAAGVLVWANLGGAAGSLLLGFLSTRISVRLLTMGVMAVSVAMVVLFGRGQADLAGLSLISAATGFFTNAGMVGLYALLARYFPTDLRATATGFAIGVGRGGSALAPALAGVLFVSGFGLWGTSAVMALGSLVALGALALLPRMRDA
ncbi:MAG TPA: MFS transporter [Sphingomonas sp.]|nr:MFS transporter [Sphingomonas sp.]